MQDFTYSLLCKYLHKQAFNQASYIKDTMDGFCMQQTNFPFVCMIMDDASTDGEPEVIKQYLNDHFDTEWTKETDDYRYALFLQQPQL